MISKRGGPIESQGKSDETSAMSAAARVDYIGQLLKGRYRIVQELGSGGFATAYRAKDEELLGKPVVVKVLHSLVADEWLLRKFQQEKEALARIDHPGVVAVLDAGQTPQGTPFLVMQFVDGVTLRKLMPAGGMDLARAGEIFRQVGHALQAAHDQGIFHRDLKPENIMVRTTEGEDYAMLIDFGIAGIENSVYSAANQSTRVAGTYRYMPPEQMEGKVRAESDIYAFGAVAFEALTGKAAVESPLQLIALKLEGLKTKPRDLRPETPDEAQTVIVKALSFEAADRYGSAREMGDLLATALCGSAGAATAHTRPVTQDQLVLAHVLFMDVVDYSTKTMEEQRDGLAELQRVVRQTAHFAEADKNGDLVALPTGDGMALVFFGDPTNAAECALEIARALRGLPHLPLRMGLHTGPVYRVADVNRNLNVSGGGINMAQRVMDAGDAGHILASAGFADVLTQLGRWQGCLTDWGEHAVKHGALVHYYNLCTVDAGNAAWPSKWGNAPALKGGTRRNAMVGLAALVLAGGGVAVWQSTKAARVTVAPAAAPKLELGYYVMVQPYRDGKPYKGEIRLASEMATVMEEHYQLSLYVNAPKDGYLYVLNEGPLPNGAISINILHPGAGTSAQMQAAQQLRVPSKGWFRLDQASGTEKLYLVWSTQAIAEIEAVKDREDLLMNGGVVVQDAGELAKLRSVLVTPAQVHTDEEQKLTLLSSDRKVLVHLIRLEHH